MVHILPERSVESCYARSASCSLYLISNHVSMVSYPQHRSPDVFPGASSRHISFTCRPITLHNILEPRNVFSANTCAACWWIAPKPAVTVAPMSFKHDNQRFSCPRSTHWEWPACTILCCLPGAADIASSIWRICFKFQARLSCPQGGFCYLVPESPLCLLIEFNKPVVFRRRLNLLTSCDILHLRLLPHPPPAAE